MACEELTRLLASNRLPILLRDTTKVHFAKNDVAIGFSMCTCHFELPNLSPNAEKRAVGGIREVGDVGSKREIWQSFTWWLCVIQVSEALLQHTRNSIAANIHTTHTRPQPHSNIASQTRRLHRDKSLCHFWLHPYIAFDRISLSTTDGSNNCRSEESPYRLTYNCISLLRGRGKLRGGWRPQGLFRFSEILIPQNLSRSNYVSPDKVCACA